MLSTKAAFVKSEGSALTTSLISLIASSETFAKKFIAFLEKERQKSPEIDYDTILWIPDDRISLEMLGGNSYDSF